MSTTLSDRKLSLDHSAFTQALATTENLLIIQDLDGVCMGLVNDPLTRKIDPEYIKATQSFGPHFYVLTNGEHIGRRGVNRIVERAFGRDLATLQAQNSYLPGLAAGGVQWQQRDGQGSHPGVSEAELAFLKAVPAQMEMCLRDFFETHSCPPRLAERFDEYVASSILDNIASPTMNLNSVYPCFAEAGGDFGGVFVELQTVMRSHLESLIAKAKSQGLTDSFFIHYAPNLGRDADGKERVWFSSGSESGTTDFQFMLRGAVKEAGVLALLNRYYHQRTSSYPLGESFNARQAPQSLDALLALAKDNFDAALMPTMVGVGDTVTAQLKDGEVKRGGSDRNFLQLIQNLDSVFNTGNFTVYVDSSGGELKNRQPLKLSAESGDMKVTQGPTDSADPLRLNVAFPGGPEQYCKAFIVAAQKRGGQRSGV
ncbi:MAG: glucosylglycerol 3-phosphatase [Cyanobacteria bacterium P01_D01_bin.36]